MYLLATDTKMVESFYKNHFYMSTAWTKLLHDASLLVSHWYCITVAKRIIKLTIIK